MNLYKKFSEDDLIIAYNEMIEISGEISIDLKEAIEVKGGIGNFLQKVEYKKIKHAETNRIAVEVFKLTSKETNLEFVSKFITSEVLSNEELKKLVEEKYNARKKILNDTTIDSSLIIACIIGIIISTILGGILWVTVIFLLPYLIIPMFFPVYILCYIIIKFITKKSRRNIIVFIASLLATIFSVILGWYLLDIFYN